MSEAVQPGDTFGKYQVVKLLGQGGFGAVYLVENELGWTQALKVLRDDIGGNEEYRTRFLREMAFARTLTHPNGVPIRDAGVVDGNLYFTMDYVEGDDLRKLLRREGAIRPLRLADWAEQLLGFLEYIHGKHVIHRDLKPENLILENPGEKEMLRVLDLGIAKALEANESMMLSQGVIVGTAAYMAPEHLSGDEIDARADLFALSVILYEAATGDHPFVGETNQQTMGRVLHRDLPPLHEVVAGFPVSLSDVIDKGLAKDRDQRHASARDYSEAVRALRPELVKAEEAEFQPTVAIDPRDVAAGKAGKKPSRGLVFGAGGAVLALAVAAVIVLGGGDDEDPASGGTEQANLPGEEEERASPADLDGGGDDEGGGDDGSQPVEGGDPNSGSDEQEAPIGDTDEGSARGAPVETPGPDETPDGSSGELDDDEEAGGVEAEPPQPIPTQPSGGEPAARFPPGFVAVSPELEALHGATGIDPEYGLPTPIQHAATGLVLVLVPASPTEGFWIGQAKGEDALYSDGRNAPPVRVVVTEPFYIGQTEVAYRHWPDVEHEIWWDEDERARIDDLLENPIVGITWDEAVAFCAERGMRLPTESEWAWCARIESSDGLYPWGDSFDAGVCNAKGDADGARFTWPVTRGGRVGRLGLYNLLGNAAEYCADVYSATRFRSIMAGQADLRFDAGDGEHVARGASWKMKPEETRISSRWPQQRAVSDVGLRVALTIPDELLPE